MNKLFRLTILFLAGYCLSLQSHARQSTSQKGIHLSIAFPFLLSHVNVAKQGPLRILVAST